MRLTKNWCRAPQITYLSRQRIFVAGAVTSERDYCEEPQRGRAQKDASN